MRRPFLVAPLLLLAAAAACPDKPDQKLLPSAGKPKVHPDAGEAPTAPHEAPRQHEILEDRRKDTLAGLPLERAESGPWHQRRTPRRDGGAREPLGEAARRVGAAPPPERFRAELDAPAPAEPPEAVPLFAPGTEGASPGTAEAGTAEAGAAKAGSTAGGLSSASARSALPAPKAKRMGSLGMRAAPPESAAPLKAGSTDDNERFDEFLKFLATWSDRPDTASQVQLLDVRDRRYLEVVNRAGEPVPGVELDVYDASTERLLASGTTYGDGRVPFFPRIGDPKGEVKAWIVNARLGDKNASATWDPQGELHRLVLDIEPAAEAPVPLDVVFVIDTTGSMSDEIQRIKETLLSVTKKVREAGKAVHLRYGAVLYRDIGDEYVTRTHPFTSDIQAFDQALKGVTAGGGGDGPESLNQGLAEAVHGVKWRPRAAKVAFLIADAQPHMDYEDDVPYGESAKDAVARGIRVHAVAASGLDPMGTLCFRQVAQLTRGRFIFIEYGSVQKSAASHGVTGEVKSNNLDDIFFEQIQWEIDHYGRVAQGG